MKMGISETEAGKRLENVVKDFGSLRSFLGNKKRARAFLDKYVRLNRQISEREKLSIELISYICEAPTSHDQIARFGIVRYYSNGNKELVASLEVDTHQFFNSHLYNKIIEGTKPKT